MRNILVFILMIAFNSFASDSIDFYQEDNLKASKMSLTPQDLSVSQSDYNDISNEVILNIKQIEFIINYEKDFFISSQIEKKLDKKSLLNSEEKIYRLVIDGKVLFLSYDSDPTPYGCEICFKVKYNNSKLKSIYELTPQKAADEIKSNSKLKNLLKGLLLKKEALLPQSADYLLRVNHSGKVYYVAGSQKEGEIVVSFTENEKLILINFKGFKGDARDIFRLISRGT